MVVLMSAGDTPVAFDIYFWEWGERVCCCWGGGILPETVGGDGKVSKSLRSGSMV